MLSYCFWKQTVWKHITEGHSLHQIISFFFNCLESWKRLSYSLIHFLSVFHICTNEIKTCWSRTTLWQTIFPFPRDYWSHKHCIMMDIIHKEYGPSTTKEIATHLTWGTMTLPVYHFAGTINNSCKHHSLVLALNIVSAKTICVLLPQATGIWACPTHI